MERGPKLKVDGALAAMISQTLKLEGFFPEFSPEHAEKLFPRSGLYQYGRDSVVMEQGDAGSDLFIVFSGHPEKQPGSRRTSAETGSGEERVRKC